MGDRKSIYLLTNECTLQRSFRHLKLLLHESRSIAELEHYCTNQKIFLKWKTSWKDFKSGNKGARSQMKATKSLYQRPQNYSYTKKTKAIKETRKPRF